MSRTYVVTGAVSGIGATTVQTLRAKGHRVIGVDLKDLEVKGDLSTPAGRLAAAEQASERAGGVVDGVIACAAISAPIAKTCSRRRLRVTKPMPLNYHQPGRSAYWLGSP